MHGAPYSTWTRSEGIVKIGGGGNPGRDGDSGDGSTIFGTTLDRNGIQQAAKWLGGTQWQALGAVEGGVPCDSSLSSGWDISDDGRLAVGLSYLPKQCNARAASWDLGDGGPATDLGSLVANRPTRANTISGDGHVIAGWQDSEIGIRQGARWVDGVGEGSPYCHQPARRRGLPHELRWDGRWSASITRSVRKTGGCGPRATASQRSRAPASSTGRRFRSAATDDGTLAFGAVRERFKGQTRAIFWRNGKATYLRDYLAARGLAAGWDMRWITAASADGGTLTGWGLNPSDRIEGFVIANFR